MNEAAGLPAAARQNPFVYFFIFLAIIGFLIFIVIWFIQKHYYNIRTSEEWIKKNENRPTNYRDIKLFAKIAELTRDERNFLFNLCTSHNARNILYLSRSIDEVDELFRSEYQDLSVLGGLEDKIGMLFKIRYKIEKLLDRQLQIRSTKSLHAEQKLDYVDKNERYWSLVLIKNNPDSMYLKVPKGFSDSPAKPEPFSKITLSVTPHSGHTYKLQTRVIRYEKDNQENEIMVVRATNLMQPILKRGAKRIAMDESECEFSAVKKTGNDLIPSEKKYRGELLDISATGCSLKCALPIKKDQFIKTVFALTEAEPVEAIGTIIVTNRVPAKELYILHIKFVKIDMASQNMINAHIYNYGALQQAEE